MTWLQQYMTARPFSLSRNLHNVIVILPVLRSSQVCAVPFAATTQQDTKQAASTC